MGCVVTDAMLASMAQQLTLIDREVGWTRVFAIGELILERFFSNDVESWRSRSSAKTHSIRKLAARKDCPFGKSALHQAVAVYVACRDLGHLRLRESLTPSHVVAVLGVPPAQRASLLAQAIAADWSVRKLKEAAAGGRRHQWGRPPKGPAEKAITWARRALLALSRARSLAAASGDGSLEERLERSLTELGELVDALICCSARANPSEASVVVTYAEAAQAPRVLQ